MPTQHVPPRLRVGRRDLDVITRLGRWAHPGDHSGAARRGRMTDATAARRLPRFGGADLIAGGAADDPLVYGD